MIDYQFINNASYNLEERERLAGSLSVNAEEPHVLLSTCNRLEVYKGEGFVPENVVRHLYRVASGLESSLVGERAVEGQLKKAYLSAKSKYKLSPALNRLFQTAMHTGKRVRNETKIAVGAVSHSQVTATILNTKMPDLDHKIIGIIGVNKLTDDILKFLVSRHTINVFLSSRRYEKAVETADKYNGTAVRLERKRDLLKCADVIISATSAPHAIVFKEYLPVDKPLLLFDLAFPRDIDPSVGDMPHVRLYNLEMIEQFARRNLCLRQKESEKAGHIIEEEIARFRHWQQNSLLHQQTY